MEEFWIQLLAILTLLTQTCSASNTTEVIGTVGGSVTFRSPYTAGYAALWNFGNEHIVAVEFGDRPQPVFYQDKFQTRFTVSEDGWALSISQLRMEDAGTYSVATGRKTSTFTLLVYKELTEPTVTCETRECLHSTCLFSLRCSVPDSGFGNVSYTWRVRHQRWDERSVTELEVYEFSWENWEPVTCTAENAVSSRNITITTLERLCLENSTCPPDPSSIYATRIAIATGIGVTGGFLLCVSMFFCKCKGWKKCHLLQSKRKDTVTTAEYTSVDAKVGPSQQVESATVTALELV